LYHAYLHVVAEYNLTHRRATETTFHRDVIIIKKEEI